MVMKQIAYSGMIVFRKKYKEITKRENIAHLIIVRAGLQLFFFFFPLVHNCFEDQATYNVRRNLQVLCHIVETLYGKRAKQIVR